MAKAKKMFEQLGYEFEKEYTSDGVNDTYRYNRCFKVDSIRFDLNGKNIIVSKIFHTISLNELQAIIQQCKELGWLEEETCTNESEYNLVDGFECSNCGIIIENYNEIEIDEDCPEDRCMKEYAPRYCPNCGRKIVD